MELKQEDVKQIIIKEMDLKDPFFNTYSIDDLTGWIIENIEYITDPDDPDPVDIQIRIEQLNDWYNLTDRELFNNYAVFNDVEILDIKTYIQDFIFPGAVTEEQIQELKQCGLSLNSFVVVDNWNEKLIQLKDKKEVDDYIKKEVDFYELNNLKNLDIELLEELTKEFY